MTFMKIVQFSGPPPPSPHPPPCPSMSKNSSTPLTLDVQFQTNSPSLSFCLSPNDNQSIKRKHNPRITIICYQALPLGRLSFSVSTH